MVERSPPFVVGSSEVSNNDAKEPRRFVTAFRAGYNNTVDVLLHPAQIYGRGEPMIDWTTALRRQAELAACMKRQVDSALSRSDLTFTEASRVQQSVDKSAKAYGRMRQQLFAADDVDELLFEAAARIEDIWSSMRRDTENLIREMLGLRVVPPRHVANSG
jgi:hypothetical protein